MYSTDGTGLGLTEFRTAQRWSAITALTTIFNGPDTLARTTTINNLVLYQNCYPGFPFHHSPVVQQTYLPTIAAFVAATKELEVVVIFPGELHGPNATNAHHVHAVAVLNRVMEIDMFTDGSEKEGAAGSGIVFHMRPPTSLSVQTPREQMNNNAELHAIETALASAPPNVEKIRFFTDSQYAIKAIQTNTAAMTSPAHNVPNQDMLHRIKSLISTCKEVVFHHVYSHVKGKLTEDRERWQPKIDLQKETLPFHYLMACRLNDLADLVAKKGATMMAISVTTSPNLYPLSKVVIHDGNWVSPRPRDILSKKWAEKWPKPTAGTPKRKYMTEALDTGIYSFLLRAVHMTLLLRDTLYSMAKGKPYDTPYCEWCVVHLDVSVREDLEHCLAACPAHNEVREKTRVAVAQLARKLSSIPTIPTSTTSNWLGYLTKPPRQATKNDRKVCT